MGKRSVFDQVYRAFDRDRDGVISAHDFQATLRGLDSETILRVHL